MSTITNTDGKTILNLDNGDMFAAKATIDHDSKSRHFLKVEQKSHKGVMQTIIDRYGATLLCSALIDVLSECDDVVGQQFYEKLHKKYGEQKEKEALRACATWLNGEYGSIQAPNLAITKYIAHKYPKGT